MKTREDLAHELIGYANKCYINAYDYLDVATNTTSIEKCDVATEYYKVYRSIGANCLRNVENLGYEVYYKTVLYKGFKMREYYCYIMKEGEE